VARRPTVFAGADLGEALRALRVELKVPGDFPAEALAEAEQAATSWSRDGRVDATGIELMTLDPTGSRDLDQAFSIEAVGGGFRFHYAIADVAAFVAPNGPMAAEAQRRGETLYLPDGRAPLYPPRLSEDAGSLLPDGERPAVLWRLDLDARAEPTAVEVRRAVVRSRAQLDYIDIASRRPDAAALLRQLGELRLQRERERGGVSLNVPEQEVSRADGAWRLAYRSPLPAEAWNAQLSLLTGMAAAKVMIDAKIGLLRTMPRPPHHVRVALRNSAAALGVAWPENASYADVIRGLHADIPAQAAMLRVAGAAFRGAHYVAFDGTVPDQVAHAAVAAPYAHATAPLRRLADRYVSEICLAIQSGTAVPEWVRTALPELPHTMAAADEHAHRVDHAVVDLAEVVLLQNRMGEVFEGIVVEADADHGELQLRDPAVHARIDGTGLPVGHEIRARLVSGDVTARRLEFEPVV
jgi:exoribonuclease R